MALVVPVSATVVLCSNAGKFTTHGIVTVTAVAITETDYNDAASSSPGRFTNLKQGSGSRSIVGSRSNSLRGAAGPGAGDSTLPRAAASTWSANLKAPFRRASTLHGDDSDASRDAGLAKHADAGLSMELPRSQNNASENKSRLESDNGDDSQRCVQYLAITVSNPTGSDIPDPEALFVPFRGTYEGTTSASAAGVCTEYY